MYLYRNFLWDSIETTHTHTSHYKYYKNWCYNRMERNLKAIQVIREHKQMVKRYELANKSYVGKPKQNWIQLTFSIIFGDSMNNIYILKNE